MNRQASQMSSQKMCTGSQDGFIRLWKCGEGFRSLTPLFTIAAKGFVNALHFTSDGKRLVAGIGQEHRLGRWWKFEPKEVKNRIIVVNLNQRQPTTTAS